MMWRRATVCLLNGARLCRAPPCTRSSCPVPALHVTRCTYLTRSCVMHAPQTEQVITTFGQPTQRPRHRRSSGNSSRPRDRNGNERRNNNSKKMMKVGPPHRAQDDAPRPASSSASPPSVPADILTAAAATASATAQEDMNDERGEEDNTRTNNTTNASPQSSSSPSREYAETMGWSYERVDPNTGTTALEELYGLTLARIHAILEQPLPPLPRDGQVSPDFFVGFGYYSYHSRDVYRAILAKELGLPVSAVRLSVAWSGRFNVGRFNRVQKVCGVVLDRSALTSSSSSSSPPDSCSTSTSNAGTHKDSGEDGELPAMWQDKVRQLIRRINGRREEELLRLHLVQASEPIPEVHFTLQRREHRLLVRLHAWLKRRLLLPNLVVIVYGGNSLVRSAGKGKGEAADTAALVVSDALLSRDAEETARQRSYITQRWLRLFHARQTVPQVRCMTTIASLLARAVLQGEVAGVKVPTAAAAAEEGGEAAAEVLLDKPIMELLRGMRDALLQGQDEEEKVTMKDKEEDKSEKGEAVHDVRDVFAAPELRGLSAVQQASAVQWLRLTRRALLLTEHSTPPDTNARSTASPLATDTAFTLENAEGDMPAVFVHGAYAGGAAEMHYLQHNAAAMNALLLHPHDVTVAKSFHNRLRSGHRRLRIYEEAETNYTGG